MFQLKEKLNERNEEIAELKAERSNTKVFHILYILFKNSKQDLNLRAETVYILLLKPYLDFYTSFFK